LEAAVVVAVVVVVVVREGGDSEAAGGGKGLRWPLSAQVGRGGSVVGPVGSAAAMDAWGGIWSLGDNVCKVAGCSLHREPLPPSRAADSGKSGGGFGRPPAPRAETEHHTHLLIG